MHTKSAYLGLGVAKNVMDLLLVRIWGAPGDGRKTVPVMQTTCSRIPVRQRGRNDNVVVLRDPLEAERWT